MFLVTTKRKVNGIPAAYLDCYGEPSARPGEAARFRSFGEAQAAAVRCMTAGTEIYVVVEF